MTIKEMMEITGARLSTAGEKANLDREIKNGMTCDLLSHVMGKGEADMAWVTVQTHMNAVAVAALLDMACVIAPEGMDWDEKTRGKAEEEEVILLSCDKTAYAICGLLYSNGVGNL